MQDEICTSNEHLVTKSFLNTVLKRNDIPLLARSVFLQSVENIPSVQSFVATSNLPNICGAVMAFGFILNSLWGVPHSVMAFISVWMHSVLPAPLGPRAIMPCRTR